MSKLSRETLADSSPEEHTIAAVYARTSSLVQRYGYSLNEQVRLCLKRCKLLGWEVQFVFRDEAESGKDTDRPMFREMMSHAEHQLIDVIVFWKLDRFSRSLLHAVQLESELREFGVALHSITEQIDTTTSSGRFNFRNLASAAEFERDMIKERSTMGLRALAMDGKWPNSRPPLGYNVSKDSYLTLCSKEVEIVEHIFERYVQIKSMPEVAHELNQQAIPTKQGNEWNGRAVRDILRNELYIGRYNVAGVSKQILSYQVISNELFEKATATRFRFKNQDARRPKMQLSRKEKLVDNVLSQYRSFLALT